MRIAFGIVDLFPGGGLQRDCVEIAKLVSNRGHDVVIYTERVSGDLKTDGMSGRDAAERREDQPSQAVRIRRRLPHGKRLRSAI